MANGPSATGSPNERIERQPAGPTHRPPLGDPPGAATRQTQFAAGRGASGPTPAKSPKPAGRKAKKAAARKSHTATSRERTARPSAMQKTLAQDLEHLRTLLQTVITGFAARLDSEIAQVREAVLSCPRSPGRRKHLEALQEVLKGLTLKKPEKGRRKDLKRIDLAVAHLNKIARKL